MVRISVEEATFERLQNHAQPLVDNSDAVINRALDALEALYQQTGIPVSADDPGADSERRIDSQRLPDLMHTKVLDATIGGELVPQPNWNLLLRRIVRVSKKRTKTFDDLNRLCPANMVQGRKQDKGYHYLPEVDVSVQAQPANAACLAIVTTAQKLGIALDIGFMWRNKEGATHPGDHARIRTTGSTDRGYTNHHPATG